MPTSQRDVRFGQALPRIYVMSALLPKADMCSATQYVRFVPIADIGHLFDHLVGPPPALLC